jgi:glyoxylase-like metal-dependent hydrolase (beta-lactamase superfamily II)
MLAPAHFCAQGSNSAMTSLATGLDYPFPQYPAPGTTTEVAPGVHWLSLPLPFRLRAVNVFLLDDGDGWTLVDCGYSREDVREQWQQAWDGLLAGKPVTRLIVTHFHPDHVGNSAWICERWGLMPLMTAGEWAAAERGVQGDDDENIARLLAFYAANGLDAAGQATFRDGVVPYRRGVRLPPAIETLADGQRLTIGGRSWQVIVGRGHSPEHASLYCEEAAALIAGDQLLPEITTNVSVWPSDPDADALGAFLDSLTRFKILLRPDTLVLPAHRRPFRGVHARIDELQRHHVERLAAVLAVVAAGPASAGDLLPHLFAAGLDGHQIMFAMGEAIAHLNYLLQRGELRRINDAGRTLFALAE